MNLINNITSYFRSASPSAAPETAPLTLGDWLSANGKRAAEVKKDLFLLNRASKALLNNKGITDPTEHQLHETRFALIEALKSDQWQEFTSPSIPGIINIELGADCCSGNVFFERDGYAQTELTPENLKLTPHLTKRLKEKGYSDGTLGQIIAGTFITGASRSKSDFSHAYGDAPWAAYLRAWTMLEQIPKGQLLEKLNVHLITETNRLTHAPDPRQESQLYRMVGAITRGSLDRPGRIREGSTFTQTYTFTDAEVDNLNSLGIKFHSMSLFDKPGTQFGYMEYPAPQSLHNRIYEFISALKTDLAQESPDEIGACARFCRQLIALHPFEDCNGRTARLLMNRLLMELGYPPAILSDVDNDLTMGATPWRDEVVEGIAHTKRYLEKSTPYPIDSYLTAERRGVLTPGERTEIVLDGIPLCQGQDGFLYDVTGRPYLVENHTLQPLSQLEHYFIARSLFSMPRALALGKLQELTNGNTLLTHHSEAGTLPETIHVGDDLAAREADSAYKIRGDFFATRLLVELLSVNSLDLADLFSVPGAHGTPISSLLSKYSQLDLQYWHVEAALREGSQLPLADALHIQREKLFLLAKEKLQDLQENAPQTTANPDGFQFEYERVMYQSSPLLHETLAAAIRADGDDDLTLWRGDYGFARMIGMAPNNDPRQTSARDNTRNRFLNGTVPHIFQELKSLERSAVGSRYLSHTTDLSLLTGTFASKVKTKPLNLTSLPEILSSSINMLAPPQTTTSNSESPSSPASGIAESLLRNTLGVDFQRRSGRDLTLRAHRTAFALNVPKSSLLPGIVSLSERHAFTKEQEVHGLEHVPPWRLTKSYTAKELSTPL